MSNIEKYQKDIYNKYKKFKIKKKLSFKEICFPKKFTFQLPQLFVENFINPKSKNDSLLIYHKIGAGKTCAAVRTTLNFIGKINIYFICPASLLSNVYKEFRSECTDELYINRIKRNKLNTLNPMSDEYNEIIKEIDDKIDNDINIYSYNKFINLLNNNKIKLENSLLIIDEVQNIVSEKGSFYSTIFKAVHKTNKLKIIIMSATPMFDRPSELGLTINLLKPRELLPISNKFNEEFITCDYNLKNEDKLKNLLNGYISYYGGAPSYAYPKRIDKIVKCPMSRYQYDSYKTVESKEKKMKKTDLLNLPNNFFISSRIISNIAFPNKLVNLAGFNALKGNLLKLDNLYTYSSKMATMMSKLKGNGPMFIYSNFREFGGIMVLIKILEYHGYKNFLDHGSGVKRYAIWSGDENMIKKEKIRMVFNSYENKDGKLIKLMLGSPAIKEGVSLFRVKKVHILEPYWNLSRLEQVIGRAIRYCSHKDVPLKERIVKVYLYVATKPKEINDKEETIDEYIYDLAIKKQKLINQFEKIMKETAIDKLLFN